MKPVRHSKLFLHVFLTIQNIFHGSMSLDQLYMSRPVPALSGYRSPVQGLYLCGSGAHPGYTQLNYMFKRLCESLDNMANFDLIVEVT